MNDWFEEKGKEILKKHLKMILKKDEEKALNSWDYFKRMLEAVAFAVNEETNEKLKVELNKTIVELIAENKEYSVKAVMREVFNSLMYGYEATLREILYEEDFDIVHIKYNRIAISCDGKNWSAIAAPEAKQWISIAYGDGKFDLTK